MQSHSWSNIACFSTVASDDVRRKPVGGTGRVLSPCTPIPDRLRIVVTPLGALARSRPLRGGTLVNGPRTGLDRMRPITCRCPAGKLRAFPALHKGHDHEDALPEFNERRPLPTPCRVVSTGPAAARTDRWRSQESCQTRHNASIPSQDGCPQPGTIAILPGIQRLALVEKFGAIVRHLHRPFLIVEA